MLTECAVPHKQAMMYAWMTCMLYETHIRKNMNNFRWFLHNLTLKYLLLLLVWANWADSTALTIPSQAKLQVGSLPIWIQSMPGLGWQWDSIPLCSAWPEVCHDMPGSYRDTKGRCDDILPTFEWSNLRLSNVLRKSWKFSVRMVTSSYFIIFHIISPCLHFGCCWLQGHGPEHEETQAPWVGKGLVEIEEYAQTWVLVIVLIHLLSTLRLVSRSYFKHLLQ